MIYSATDARPLFQYPEPGCGLPCIQQLYTRARQLQAELTCVRRDATHALDDVEGNTFGR